jgi:hypothetical protein
MVPAVPDGAGGPRCSSHADLRADLEHRLRALMDPEAVDHRAREAQGRRIVAAGGAARIIGVGDQRFGGRRALGYGNAPVALHVYEVV